MNLNRLFANFGVALAIYRFYYYRENKGLDDMNETVNEQVENQVELTAGEMLRNARTTGRRKREIATVAKQLCIREEFLQALEDGNYSFIPETVYILGFARNYAMELGLNPDEIVAKIKREMGLIPECAASGADSDTGSDVGACPIANAKNVKSVVRMSVFARAYQFFYKNWVWFIGAFAALVVVLVAISVLKSSSDPVAETAAVVAPAPTAAKPEPAYNQPVRERFGTENSADGNVVIQAAAESWVKIEDGRGNTVFSRVLVPGDVYFVPAGDRYKGTFGNAGGIDVWVDGKLAPKIGEDHSRKTGVSMAPDSLMAGAKE